MINVASDKDADARLLRHRWLVYLSIAALLAAGLVVGVAALDRRHADAASPIQPTPTLTVTSAMPRRAVWPMTLEASGAIAPWQEASIAAQIGGYQLIDVRVNVGDQVEKGQVLARLDPALLEADETLLRANDDEAEINLRRFSSLQRSGAASDQVALQHVTQAKTAAALLAAKRLQLRYTEVRAPDDGAISSRSATLGAVTPVGQELFRLIRQNRLEWRGELTAGQLAHIAPGQQIGLSLPDGGTAAARIRQIAPSLDPLSRLGIVYADIAPGGSARAGMYANGRVVLGQADSLAVPAQSVVIRDGRNYVLKLADLSANPRVSLQPVVIGRRQGDEVEIVSGVNDDDRLVVEGAGFLNDGDVVRVVNASGAAIRPGAAQ
jgi:RND family efflux transporter MFP subunit